MIRGKLRRGPVYCVWGVHLLTPQTSAIEQVKMIYAFRICNCKTSCNPATQRITNQRHLWITQAVQKAFQIQDMCCNIKPFWCWWRFAKTWQIRSIHQILSAQTQNERRPDFGRITNTMNQHDGGAATACTVVMDREIPNITGFLTHACQQQRGAGNKNRRFDGSTINLYRQSSCASWQ